MQVHDEHRVHTGLAPYQHGSTSSDSKGRKGVGKHADNEAVVRTENFLNCIESAVESSLIDAIAEWKAD